jgi:hypothetical protein
MPRTWPKLAGAYPACPTKIKSQTATKPARAFSDPGAPTIAPDLEIAALARPIASASPGRGVSVSVTMWRNGRQ